MLEKIEEMLVQEKPDFTLVYGDTNTTLAGALAAVKLHIPVAHVEAGLRSFNRHMPEEINRLLTDHVANILFCPTKKAVENLEVEGIGESPSLVSQCVESSSESEKSISDDKLESLSPKPPINSSNLSYEMPQTVAFVGDVMLDAVLYYKEQARKPQFAIKAPFILATLHRAENTDNPMRLKSIFNGFEKVSKEIPIILPLHPRTKKAIASFNLNISNPNLIIAKPVGYLEIIYLLGNCLLVMTDSGGLQKEAFFFKKPCITLRDETEWVELIENGFNYLVEAEAEHIYDTYKKVIKTNSDFNVELYGDGSAGDRIVNFLHSCKPSFINKC
jgi:UDP-GlcNAc3NAcA epimerase